MQKLNLQKNPAKTRSEVVQVWEKYAAQIRDLENKLGLVKKFTLSMKKFNAQVVLFVVEITLPLTQVKLCGNSLV